MSASKIKGTAFETLILQEAKLWYPGAERRALQGNLDKGDLILPGEDRFVVECKNVSRFNLSEWHREAKREAANAGVEHGVIAHKRRGNGKPGEQWVTLEASSFFALVNSSRKGK